MTEGISAGGLTLKDYNTLRNELQTGLIQTYAQDGDTINLGSETPDGQMTNIFTQAGTDIRELYQEVYNSFDPSKCSGVVQDSRFQLNYLTRRGGTFTIQNIDVTVNKTVTLNGLDADYDSLDAASYTVSDDAGNLWYLIDTTTILAGTHSLPFRSQTLGLVQPTIGTITNQVTKVLGVTSIINSVAPTTLGEDQETDAEFRIRRERSTAIRGQNNKDAMLGQILSLNTVSDADIWVNNTNSTDETGTAANTVWVIVEGGANSDIAEIIYTYSDGMNTRGSVTVDVPAISGQIFTTHFDRPTPVPLYIQFDFKLTVEIEQVDIEAITEYIANNLIYSLNEDAETSKITNVASEAIAANGGGGFALNVEISLNNTTWTDFIASSSRANKFVTDTTRITINTIEIS
jgi:hypothetical protein